MKIFGYLDDISEKVCNLQVSAGNWNYLIIPIELMIIFWLIFKFWKPDCCMD